jgi:hypothetical protein
LSAAGIDVFVTIHAGAIAIDVNLIHAVGDSIPILVNPV